MPKQFYYKNNRWQQLKGFCLTVQTGSMSKAAEKMGLTQGAVSLQIKSLERDLKTSLFRRSKNKLKITKEGEKFYASSISYIQGVDQLFKEFAQNIDVGKSKIINIAANHAGISYILPKYIKKFKDTNRQAEFKIRNLSKDEAVKRLLNDEIDMFIYPFRKNEVPPEMKFIPIVNYQPILLIKKNHPLAKKKNLTLQDISKYELVRIDPKFITLPAFEEIIESYNFKTNIEFEMSDWEILKKFVKAEIGVAMISNICLEGEEDGELIGRVLTNYFPEMTYGILLKKEKKFGGLAESFLKILENEKLLKAHQN